MVVVVVMLTRCNAYLKPCIFFFPDDLIYLCSLQKGNNVLIRELYRLCVLLVTVPNISDITTCVGWLLEKSINELWVFFNRVLLPRRIFSIVELAKVHALAFCAAELFAVCRVMFMGNYLIELGLIRLIPWNFINLNSGLRNVKTVLLAKKLLQPFKLLLVD